MNDTMMTTNFLRAPLPNIGKCEQVGSWAQTLEDTGLTEDENMQKCLACVKKNERLDPWGYKYFYCRGKCYDNYSADGYGCDYSDAVAKRTDQCTNPCLQVDLPGAHPECSDQFDCNGGQCVGGRCASMGPIPTVAAKTMPPTPSPSAAPNRALQGASPTDDNKFLWLTLIVLVVLFIGVSVIGGKPGKKRR